MPSILRVRDENGNVTEIPAIVGPRGATFTPSVDEDGNLSWSNDKGLPNPTIININGADGHTPVKGTDYWTADDQQAIVNDVLAALPTWTGGSY